jgi:glucan phosphoethanolaminetransferase (alkaline phosphatase superfamily)
LKAGRRVRWGTSAPGIGSVGMADKRQRAAVEFRRMMLWIVVIGVLMVIAALWYISLFEPLRLHMVIATIAGVFFSVLLGSGLFALAFYSDKSGYDQDVTDATKSEREGE